MKTSKTLKKTKTLKIKKGLLSISSTKIISLHFTCIRGKKDQSDEMNEKIILSPSLFDMVCLFAPYHLISIT